MCTNININLSSIKEVLNTALKAQYIKCLVKAFYCILISDTVNRTAALSYH